MDRTGSGHVHLGGGRIAGDAALGDIGSVQEGDFHVADPKLLLLASVGDVLQ